MAKEKLDLTKYEKKAENQEPKRPSSVMGRPSKYKKEFADKLIEYFDVEPFEEVQVEYTNKKGETWSKTERRATRLPTFERFAFTIGVDVRTLENWYKAKRGGGAPRFPEFFRAYTRAKALQKDILLVNALNGGYNPAYSIFLSKNITDMREKVELPVDDQGNPVPVVSGFQFVIPKEKEKDDAGKTNNNTDD